MRMPPCCPDRTARNPANPQTGPIDRQKLPRPLVPLSSSPGAAPRGFPRARVTALLGTGFGAAGTAGDKAERDYRYGVIPEPLVGLRLIVSDRAMLEAQARQYWIVGLGAGVSPNAERFGHETILRSNVGLTVRVYGPHALSLNYVVSRRDARVAGVGDRHQPVETVTLSYNFLGHTPCWLPCG
jgi:hypothetical protein